MSDVRNTKKVRALAADLRQGCAQQGVTLVDGQAEDIVAARIEELARQLGVTHRTFINSYLRPELVTALVAAVVEANVMHREAADTAESITVSAAGAGRVVAALAMVMKLAVNEMQRQTARTDALGVATDGADAIAGIGFALREAGPGAAVTVGGSAVMFARKVLHRTIELIGDGSWVCPCGGQHGPAGFCRLQRSLAGDLGVIGGWAGGLTEAPADQR